MQTNSRFAALDPLRGILCILVVLEHASVAMWADAYDHPGWDSWLRKLVLVPLSYDLGAPLFFVISGYCIGASLISMQKKNQSPFLFLAKRVWRIFPPYWAAMLCLATLVVTLDTLGVGWLHRGMFSLELYSPTMLTSPQWLGNLTLTETWRPLVGGGAPIIFSRICWSLCYQEQFYLICLAALLLAPRRLVPALGGATLVIVAVKVISWDIGAVGRIEGLFFDYWHQFAAGLLVFWRLNLAGKSPWRWSVEIALLAMLIVGARVGLATTMAAALLGLALIALRQVDHVIDRQAWLDPLRKLGSRSYGVYLAHLPACVVIPELLPHFGVHSFWGRALLTVPLATVVGIASGWLFHGLVDRHFQKLPSIQLLNVRRPRIFSTDPAASGYGS